MFNWDGGSGVTGVTFRLTYTVIIIAVIIGIVLTLVDYGLVQSFGRFVNV